MEVIEGGFGKQETNTALADELSALADAVESGEVGEFVASFARDEQYEVITYASPVDAMVLANLMLMSAQDCFVQ